jgi:Na+/H+ antiporter NhaC
MLRAERKRLAPDYDPAETDYAARLDIDEEIRPSHWLNAVLPISVTLLGVVLLLYRTGSDALAERTGGQAETSLRDIFGAADSSLALQYGALAGLLLAAGLSWMQRLLTGQQIVDAMRRGAGVVLPAIAILWCASSLSRMTGNRNLEGVDSLNDRGQETFAYRDHRLYTGDYLTGLIAGGQQTATGQGGESGAGVGAESTLRLLPTLVFLLASIVAFCTGTSFGTMGILVPMVITLTHALLASRGSPVTADDPILLATIGSVLAGAVFGDHCSPISDTTILSSQSCACDHIAHVMTQLPYALTVATMAVLLGTLPIGWGVSVWILLPLQALALAAIVWRVGKPCEESAPRPEA